MLSIRKILIITIDTHIANKLVLPAISIKIIYILLSNINSLYYYYIPYNTNKYLYTIVTIRLLLLIIVVLAKANFSL